MAVDARHTSPAGATSKVDPTHAHAEDQFADRVPEKNTEQRRRVVDPPEGVVPEVNASAENGRQKPEESALLATDDQILSHEITERNAHEKAGAVVVRREVPPRVRLGHTEHHWLQVPQLEVWPDVEQYVRSDAREHTDQNGTGNGQQTVKPLSVIYDDEDGTD